MSVILRNVLVPEESPRALWVGPMLFVVVDDPEQVSDVLNSKYCVDKPFIPYYFFGLKTGKRTDEL